MFCRKVLKMETMTWDCFFGAVVMSFCDLAWGFILCIRFGDRVSMPSFHEFPQHLGESWGLLKELWDLTDMVSDG